MTRQCSDRQELKTRLDKNLLDSAIKKMSHKDWMQVQAAVDKLLSYWEAFKCAHDLHDHLLQLNQSEKFSLLFRIRGSGPLLNVLGQRDSGVRVPVLDQNVLVLGPDHLEGLQDVRVVVWRQLLYLCIPSDVILAPGLVTDHITGDHLRCQHLATLVARIRLKVAQCLRCFTCFFLFQVLPFKTVQLDLRINGVRPNVYVFSLFLHKINRTEGFDSFGSTDRTTKTSKIPE